MGNNRFAIEAKLRLLERPLSISQNSIRKILEGERFMSDFPMAVATGVDARFGGMIRSQPFGGNLNAS